MKKDIFKTFDWNQIEYLNSEQNFCEKRNCELEVDGVFRTTKLCSFHSM